MKLVFEVSFLYDTDNCFFYLNEKNLELLQVNESSFHNCFEINVISFSKPIYCTINSLPKSGLGDDQIGVNYQFARLIHLEEGGIVTISKVTCSPLTYVTVSPKDQHDYDIIAKYSNKLEHSVLNQVVVVARDQIVPVSLFSNIIIHLKIESLLPEVQFGLLQQQTEIMVLTPSERSARREIKEPGPEQKKVSIYYAAIGILQRSLQFFYKWYRFLRFYFFLKGKSEIKSKKGFNEKALSKGDQTQIFKYKIGSNLIIKNSCPDQLMSRFILLKKFPLQNTVAGPFSSKIFCRIKKAKLSSKKSHNYEIEDTAYVVSSSENSYNLNNDAYCPNSVMECLNLKVGSFITIEKLYGKSSENVTNPYGINNRFIKPTPEEIADNKFDFSIKMRDIYKNVVKTVLDNIKYKQKVNTLIVGDTGAGKTFMLNSLIEFFNNNFFHCVKLNLKTMRLSKIGHLRMEIEENLDKCCQFEPSIFFIDDMDALMIQDDEENHQCLLYSQRVGDLVISLLNSCQKNYDVYFVATACSLLNLKSFSTERGPLLFQVIHEIVDLDVDEREAVTRKFISDRYEDSGSGFIRDIAYKTKGYNIQDLSDLVEIASFNSHSRRDQSDVDSGLNRSDFELALTEKVPLSLHGVNLTKNVDAKWEFVGGMEEPKRLLMEIFDWPLRYKEIYKSSPLRLQCGVLLYGVPGTGKTLLAGAVANKCGLNFISVKGPEIFSKYVGASEEGIRDLFIRARKAKPCLLFFDEFDSVAPQRGTSNMDVNDRVVNQLLTELDGVEELTDVFILAATSRPDLLDPALLRPGRIDRAIHCDLPTLNERILILSTLKKKVRFAEDVNLGKLAEMTEDYTGADLRAILYAAQTEMIKELLESGINEPPEEFEIENKHVLAALKQTQPSLSARDKEMYQTIYDKFLKSRLGGVTQKLEETGARSMFA